MRLVAFLVPSRLTFGLLSPSSSTPPPLQEQTPYSRKPSSFRDHMPSTPCFSRERENTSRLPEYTPRLPLWAPLLQCTRWACRCHSSERPAGNEGPPHPAGPMVLMRDSLEAPSSGLGRTKRERRKGISSYPEHCSPPRGGLGPFPLFWSCPSADEPGSGGVGDGAGSAGTAPPIGSSVAPLLMQKGGLGPSDFSRSQNLDNRKSAAQPPVTVAINQQVLSLCQTPVLHSDPAAGCRVTLVSDKVQPLPKGPSPAGPYSTQNLIASPRSRSSWRESGWRGEKTTTAKWRLRW